MTEVSDLFSVNDAINNAIAELHCTIFFLLASLLAFATASSALSSATHGIELQAFPHCWLVKAAFNCSLVLFH